VISWYLICFQIQLAPLHRALLSPIAVGRPLFWRLRSEAEHCRATERHAEAARLGLLQSLYLVGRSAACAAVQITQIEIFSRPDPSVIVESLT
jgi:hypothetical protein